VLGTRSVNDGFLDAVLGLGSAGGDADGMLGVDGVECWDVNIFFALSHFRTPSLFVGSFDRAELMLPPEFVVAAELILK
jgi:hypothetical protein